MKIETIHINGFGIWNDRTWGPLSPGVNVFHGPNETGKSTLMAFIRAILFGFDRRGSARRYEPVGSAAHGGWLALDVQGRPVRIERKPGRHARGTVTVYDDRNGALNAETNGAMNAETNAEISGAMNDQMNGEIAGGDEYLENLLHGTTRTLYHNVFAFGLEELEQFHTLQEQEVAQHITGAGLGIGASRWTGVQRDLDDRQSALFLPRGQTSAINVALKELEAVRDDLDRTENQPEDYWAAHEARTRLSAEVAALEDIVALLKISVSRYEARLKSRPLRERRRRIDAQLRELPLVESFPAGGLERLDMFRERLTALEAESGRLRRESAERRLRQGELQPFNDPEDRARRAQVIDTLRSLAPRVESVQRFHAAAEERQRSVIQEKQALESTLQGLGPPSLAAFSVFIILIWIGGAGLAWAGHEIIAASTMLVTLIPLFWYRWRVATLAARGEEIKGCEGRLGFLNDEVKGIESEARQIETEIRKLTGNNDVSQQDIDVRVAEFDRLCKISEEVRRLTEAGERAEADSARVRTQMEDAQAGIQALFMEAGASIEAEFLARAGIYRQRQELIAELEKIPLDVSEPGLLFDVHADDEEALERSRRELAETEQRLIDARHESGRVHERITVMERSEERSRALARQETILARIEGDAEQWAIVTLCRALLDETRKIYENERQPEVLRQASHFFKLMTSGVYARVFSPLDGTDIQVERADGVRMAPQLLSRGTAEQLYLAMRLALVREYANHVDPLPVVFDDVLVNFDSGRVRNTLHAVRDLAETHQVLVFTCHDQLVGQFQEIVPNARIFPLQ